MTARLPAFLPLLVLLAACGGRGYETKRLGCGLSLFDSASSGGLTAGAEPLRSPCADLPA